MSEKAKIWGPSSIPSIFSDAYRRDPRPSASAGHHLLLTTKKSSSRSKHPKQNNIYIDITEKPKNTYNIIHDEWSRSSPLSGGEPWANLFAEVRLLDWNDREYRPRLELPREDINARLISASEIWTLQLTEFSLNELVHYVNVAAVFVELDFARYGEALLRLAQFTQAIKRHVTRLSHPLLVVIPPDLTPAREVRDAIVRAGGLPFFAPKAYTIAADRTARLRSLYSYLQQLRTTVTRSETHESPPSTREAPTSENSRARDLLAEINGEDE